MKRRPLPLALSYLTLAAGSILFLLPFFWMLSTALKPADQVLSFPPKWIPSPPRWENFAEGWRALPFTRYLANTVIITASVVLGVVFSASLAAYAFARLRWRGRDSLFLITLATMMLPPQVTMIPVFILFRELGWLNTFLPLTVPSWLGGGAFYIFLLRQFMLTIPDELEDAARIDGCSSFGIYSRIVLPLIRPALAVVAVFTFMGAWNDFMGPLIYLTTPDRFTLSLGLQFFTGMYSTTMHFLMAVSLLVMTPCLLLFFLAQRQFVQGITLTGLKD